MTDRPTHPPTDPPTELETIEVSESGAPVLRVVKGHPTPEELAALVAVVASLRASAPAPAGRRTPVWNAPARLTRVVHRHGAGAWRASGLPR